MAEFASTSSYQQQQLHTWSNHTSFGSTTGGNPFAIQGIAEGVLAQEGDGATERVAGGPVIVEEVAGKDADAVLCAFSFYLKASSE
jgi:hypothetical protein